MIRTLFTPQNYSKSIKFNQKIPLSKGVPRSGGGFFPHQECMFCVPKFVKIANTKEKYQQSPFTF